eukprot:scaffold867_cov176-Ochromonas_danica.AAC.3
MAGNDGNIYELDYSYSENPWASLVGGAPQHKCRKINHFAWQWSLVNIVPPFLRSLAELEDTLADIVVDNTRNILYAVTAQGVLNAFYLGRQGQETIYFGKSFRLLEESRSFLSSGRGAAESSPKADTFKDVTLPGFQVTGLFPLAVTESKKVHLVAVLANGVRIYVSILVGSRMHYMKPATSPNDPIPNGLEIAHVRSPPSAATLSNATQAGRYEDNADIENGSVPLLLPAQSLQSSCSYYSHGLYLLAVEKPQQPDELVAIYEDAVLRNSVSTSISGPSPLPCLREGVSVPLDANSNTGKIYDIKENVAPFYDETFCELRSLFAHSRTPMSNNLIRDLSQFAAPSHRATVGASPTPSPKGVLDVFGGWLDQNIGVSSSSQQVPTSYSNTLFTSSSTGYDLNNFDQLITLNEGLDQFIPSSSCFSQRQILVLTNQGIQVFKKLRPIDIMSRFLSQGQRHSDDLVKRCFALYGQLPACILCLAVACAIPRDTGGAPVIDGSKKALIPLPLNNIQQRAVSTLLAFATPASYRALAPTTSSSALHDSRLVVSGNNVEYIKSTSHDALYAFLGRVLRPIWLRPVVQKMDLKIVSFWRSGIIDEIRRPLNMLADLMRNYFSAAIMGNYHKSAAANDQFNRGGMAGMGSSLMTNQIAARAQQQVNPERLLQYQAKLLEDESMQSFYLLVSRSLHALAFIDALVALVYEWNLPISLVELADCTFRSLVVLPRMHSHVKKIIQEIIQTVSKIPSKEQVADELIDLLSRECYHYFSAGDRYSYEAFRLVEIFTKRRKASDETMGNIAELNTLAARSVDYFVKAAATWNSVEDVMGDRSDLQQACTALLSLGSVGYQGIVDIALKAANSFRVWTTSSDHISVSTSLGRPPSSSAAPSSSSAGANQPVSSWDTSFFHGGSILTASDASLCVDACYRCLVQQISWVGSEGNLGSGLTLSNSTPSSTYLADRSKSPANRMVDVLAMVQRTLSTSNDIVLHEMLFDRLLNERSDVLLQVSSPHLEPFLRGRDPVFLYKYYEHGGEYKKAAALMATLATVDEDLNIVTRIEYLTLSLTSAGKRQQDVEALTALAPNERLEVYQTVSELKDALDVADYQKRAYDRLALEFSGYNYDSANPASRNQYSETERRGLDTMQQHVFKLQLKLLDVNTLFHEICLRYRMWDICIMLIHVCAIQDFNLLARLWRSFIYRLVPEKADNKENQLFLKKKRESGRLDIDRRHSYTQAIFEDADHWLPALRAEVQRVLSHLVTLSSPVALPIPVLIEELEELLARRRVLSSRGFDRRYTAQLLCEAGVDQHAVLEAYLDVIDHSIDQAVDYQLQLLSSFSAMMKDWIATAERLDRQHQAAAYIEMIRSGMVLQWLEKARKHVASLHGRGLERSVLDEVAQELHSTQQDMLSLMLAQGHHQHQQQ